MLANARVHVKVFYFSFFLQRKDQKTKRPRFFQNQRSLGFFLGGKTPFLDSLHLTGHVKFAIERKLIRVSQVSLYADSSCVLRFWIGLFLPIRGFGYWVKDFPTPRPLYTGKVKSRLSYCEIGILGQFLKAVPTVPLSPAHYTKRQHRVFSCITAVKYFD